MKELFRGAPCQKPKLVPPTIKKQGGLVTNELSETPDGPLFVPGMKLYVDLALLNYHSCEEGKLKA